MTELSSLSKQALNGFSQVENFVLGEWSGCADYEKYETYLNTIHSALKKLQHYEETEMINKDT